MPTLTSSTTTPTFAPDPYFVVGVHGVLRLHSWVTRGLEQDTIPNDDVFSLLATRSVALGLAQFNGDPQGSVRWHQHEAGEDWVQDGRTRQVAWFQAEPADLSRQRLPIWPALTCLNDVLGRVGTLSPVGTHAVLPLHVDAPANAHFDTSHNWFPTDDDSQPRREFTVSLHTTRRNEGLDSAALVAEMQDRAAIVLSIEALNGQQPPGVPDPADLAGTWLLGADLAAIHLLCRTPEWSLDMAAFTTDVVADAARAAGVHQPLLVSIFRTEADT